MSGQAISTNSGTSGGLWTTTFVYTSMIHFFTTASFAMLIPTLPLFASSRLHANNYQLGWLIGVFTLFVLVSRFPSGYLLGRFGSSLLLRGGLPIMLVVVGLYFGAASLSALLVARALHGWMYGIVMTATSTRVAETVPLDIRGKGIGYFGMFQAVSTAIGPPVGLFLLQRMPEALFATITVFAAVSVLLELRLGKQGGRSGQAAAGGRPLSAENVRERKGWIERSALPATFTMLFAAVVYGCIVSYLPVLAQGKGLSDWVGLFFFCYAVGLFVVRPLSGKLVDAGQVKYAVWLGLFAIAAGTMLTGLSHTPALLIGSALPIGAGYGLAQTALQTLALKRVPPSRYGAATGTFFLSLDIGYSLGSIGLGYLLLAVDLPTLFSTLWMFPVLAGGLFWRLGLPGNRGSGTIRL